MTAFDRLASQPFVYIRDKILTSQECKWQVDKYAFIKIKGLSICWEYWCRARTRRVWSGVSVAPQLQSPAQPRGRDGPVTDSAGPETGGDTCHQEHQQCSVRPAVRRSVNEETRLSVKIQFCFGRVPIHSWTWQIFFIINHMLARTHNLLPNAACSRYSENCNVWIEK